MYYSVFLPSLDLLSNIQKLKSFILTGLRERSISLPLISHQLEVPFSSPRAHGSTWGLSLTGSSHFTNTSTSTWIKLFLQSSIWDFLEIHHEISTQIRNTSYIGTTYFPLHYTDSSYSFTTKLLYYTPWKSSEKYREGLPFRYWELSEHHLRMVLKPSLVLFLLNSTSKSSQAGLSYELLHFQRIILSEHSWTIPSISASSLLPTLSMLLLSVRNQLSKGTSLILATNYLKYFHLLLLSTLNLS